MSQGVGAFNGYVRPYGQTNVVHLLNKAFYQGGVDVFILLLKYYHAYFIA